MCNTWANLERDCLTCKKCSLCETRTNVVFGEGNINSKVMLIGEGPGKEEDLQGRPFVGRSGKLLDKMLEKVGLSRQKNIYIANIVKCRPPQNRDPLPGEQNECMNWLRSQFTIINPKIIVALGRIAAARVIKPDLKITKEHGIIYKKKDIFMMAVFHPAALLRDQSKISFAEQDFAKLKHLIDKNISYS
ncbi:MAG: uracil-DNA glycosylase [Oscillospiraceae bacterium]|jgi:DNA polymerase|nr:uracil-DNA glycosylase [Oscillospiraceae bacterium]